MTESYSPETLNSGQNWWFFVPCNLEIWLVRLKNKRAPLMYHVKLCVLFQSHGWTQTSVAVYKRSIRVKIVFLSRATLKFDGWPWKTMRDLFYTTPSFVRHFKSIHQWIQTWVTVGKHSIRVKIGVCCPVWPWSMTDDLEKQQGTSSILLQLQSGNAQFGSKSTIFFSLVTLKYDKWIWKRIGSLS